MLCNAGRGRPCAFMDRSILEGIHIQFSKQWPLRYAIGADQGYIYVRAEYSIAVNRLDCAYRLGIWPDWQGHIWYGI